MEAPSLDPKLQLLQGVPLFAGLAAEELEASALIREWKVERPGHDPHDTAGVGK